MDQVTAGTATAAVVSPIWLPWLHSASETAALVMPILGAVWLAVQIGTKLAELRRK